MDHGPFLPRAAGGTDPVAWIFDCHARVGRLAAGLRALADVEGDDPRARPTARVCERYLRLALPMHAEDEDRSLLPRLLAMPGGAALDRALERMTSEHLRIHSELPAILDVLDAVLGGSPVTRAQLGEAAAWCEGLLVPHVRHEERVILPAAARLPPDTLARIGQEMRARRAGPAAAESP